MYFENLDIAQLFNASKHEVLYAQDGAMRKRYHQILSTGEGGIADSGLLTFGNQPLVMNWKKGK